MENLPHQKSEQAGGACVGTAALVLPSNIFVDLAKTPNAIPIFAKCANNDVASYEWNAAPGSPIFVHWNAGPKATDVGEQRYGLCPRLDSLTLQLRAPANQKSTTYLTAKGALDTLTKAERSAGACVARARSTWNASDPKNRTYDQEGTPTLDEIGILDAFGVLVPTGHVTNNGRSIQEFQGFSACAMDGAFYDQGLHATFSGVLSARLLVPPTPYPRRQATQNKIGDFDAPSRDDASLCPGSAATAVASAQPTPVGAAATAAPSPSPTPPDGTPTLKLRVAGVTADLPTADLTQFRNPATWQKLSFQNATINTGSKGSLFGHDVVQSQDAQGASTSTKVVLADNTLCLGIHLSPHHIGEDDKDIAYGILRLCQANTKPDAAAFKCPWPAPDDTTMYASGFTAQLPEKEPAQIRLGVGSLLFSGVQIDVLNDFTKFDNAIGPDRLSYLGCRNLALLGSAAVASINVGKGTPLASLGPSPLVGQAAADSGSVDPSLSPFTAAPSFGIGGGCSIFSLQGFLPLQLTPQSLIIITSLVAAVSKDADGGDLYYLSAAGSVTSGNVTAVISAIGFRTISKRSISANQADAKRTLSAVQADARPTSSANPKATPSADQTDSKRKGSGEVPDIADGCRKSYHETKFGNLCVVSDINWPLTAGITTAQNADTIYARDLQSWRRNLWCSGYASLRFRYHMKIAIIATRGVIPQKKYGFQDEVSGALLHALNAVPGEGADAPRTSHGMWEMSVVFPTVAPPPVEDPILAQKAHLVRLYHRGDDPEAPRYDFFDIHEAYWSPIDKGKTNAASVVAWLVRTVFLPFNDVARYMASRKKVAWDVGFILAALLLGLALLGVAFIAFVWSVGALDAIPKTGVQLPPNATVSLAPDFGAALAYLTDPKKIATQRTLVLLIGGIGAYIFAQGVHALSSIYMNRTELRRDPVQIRSRIIAVTILFAVSLTALLSCAYYFQRLGGWRAGCVAIVLVVAFLCVKGSQSLAFWFVANFFGDVQIYTTRDNNSSFFALREAILAVVTRTVLDVIQRPPDHPNYDRVYILAHSLGSTISMDALIRVFNMQCEGLVTRSQYEKIRGFVTFGTALEKTKYFFDVWNPTLSQQYDEWRNDIYGSLFTDDAEVLTGSEHRGIYWQNAWYFTDFVSDEIASYRSFVPPNGAPSLATDIRASLRKSPPGETHVGRLVAFNRTKNGPFAPLKFHFVTHGDYLSDPWFWNGLNGSGGVLEVVATDLRFDPEEFNEAGRQGVLPPGIPKYVETVRGDIKADYRTRDIITSEEIPRAKNAHPRPGAQGR